MSHSDQRFTFVVHTDVELAAERAEPSYNGIHLQQSYRSTAVATNSTTSSLEYRSTAATNLHITNFQYDSNTVEDAQVFGVEILM